MCARLRVVVADDDRMIRDLMTAWLTRLGHDVRDVWDGRVLVEACRAAPPDLVISDVRMPGMDGLAAAAVLRTELDIPVVLMSGSWEPAEADRAAALGATRLDKPIRQLDLVAAIAACPAPIVRPGMLNRRAVKGTGDC